jgi:hypothetical protein
LGLELASPHPAAEDSLWLAIAQVEPIINVVFPNLALPRKVPEHARIPARVALVEASLLVHALVIVLLRYVTVVSVFSTLRSVCRY